MGRNNKKRKHRDLPVHSRDQESSYGVGDIMPQLKKPRLSAEPSDMTDDSSMTTPEAIPVSNGGNAKPRDPDDDGGWQTVSYKSSGQSAKRDAHGKKTKYPELIFHSQKQDSLRLADLQQLILYTFADGVAPNWLAFKHSGHTRKIVCLMVPGLEKEMFDGSLDLFSDEGGEPEETAAAAAETTNSPAPEGRSNPMAGADQRKRDEFNRWKNGQQIHKSKSSDFSPVDIKASTLPSCLKPIADVFTQVWPVKAPGDSKYAKIHSPLQAMLISPLSQKTQDKKVSEGPQSFDAVRTPISQFVHSADELREADYPIHPAAFTSMEDGELEKERRVAAKQSSAAGWVDSAVTEPDPVNRLDRGGLSLRQGYDVYAIDCEMVLTEDDVYSLARISIVDWSGKTVLDKYVKPALPVKNYFTQYSGITPALLENVTTTLSEIQDELLRISTPSTILLGHSLESDLNALKFTHPFVTDTSLIYPHPRGPPLRSSLKYLANKYLHREIQSGGENGHNSVEDALAVLDLVKLKCEKGPKFGTFEASGEPIFRRLASGWNKRSTAIVDYGTPERGFGKEANFAIGCKDDEEAVTGVIRAVKGDPAGEEIKSGGVDFVWGRLRELESYRGWCNNNREYASVDGLHANGTANANTNGTTASTEATTVDPPPLDGNDRPATSPPTLQSTLSKTISHITAIHTALPPCTLFIIYSGTGDPREVGRLQKMQSQYRKEFKVKKWDELTVKWTDVEEQALRKAVEKARSGCGFLVVK